MKTTERLTGWGRAAVGLLLLLGAVPGVRAQTPAWQTAAALDIDGPASVQATAYDAAGNVYVVGQFFGAVRFGSVTLTSTARNTDMFVAKWNPANGTFWWVRQAGGVSSAYATSLAVSGTSVYVAGGFATPTMQLGSLTLTNAGVVDSYVAKLTDAGSSASFTWAQRGGGAGRDGIRGMVLSGNSLYVVGELAGVTGSYGTTTLQNADPAGRNADLLVARLTDAGSSGSWTWALAGGSGPSDELGRAIAVSGPNVYVAGDFEGSAATAFGTTVLTNAGPATTKDAYVAKVTETGGVPAFAWALGVGGLDLETAQTLAVNGSSVYLGGIFSSSSLSFGGPPITKVGRFSDGDVYVAKLTDAGSTAAFEWALGVGSSGSDNLGGLAVRGTGVYVAGDFGGPTASLGSRTLANSGSGAELFVARLEDAGPSASVTWAERAGGVGADYLYCLTLHGNTLLVGGFITPLAAFGSLAVVAPLGTSVPFLATLTDPVLTPVWPGSPPLVFSLSPNPARGAATVRLPALPGVGHATLTLLDALGRPVRRQQLPLLAAGSTAQVLLAGLAPGLYHLRVVAGACQASQAVAVE